MHEACFTASCDILAANAVCSTYGNILQMFKSLLLPLVHSFILRREEVPVCLAYGAVITVKRILIVCADLLEIRNILKRDLCFHSFGT